MIADFFRFTIPNMNIVIILSYYCRQFKIPINPNFSVYKKSPHS